MSGTILIVSPDVAVTHILHRTLTGYGDVIVFSRLQSAFERLIPTFYDPEDREAGFIQACDREGRMRSYPIIGISIGIARTYNGAFSHYGELTSLASEMRQFAKQHPGSCYRINQRNFIP